MTRDEKMASICMGFSILWTRALEFTNDDEREALNIIRIITDDMEETIINHEIDGYVARFDANWDRATANH